MATGAAWARSYARQARADFDAFAGSPDPATRRVECHRLMFLQMACEKLTKASLCQGRSRPADLQGSHAYTRKNLPRIVEAQLIAFAHSDAQVRALMRHVRRLSQEIELLAPAVKRGGRRPDNSEYPWEDSRGGVRSPLDERFAIATLLAEGTAGRLFLKAVSSAIDEYARV